MKTSKNLHTFSVRLPASLFEQLKEKAARERRPLGSLVTEAVTAHLDRGQALEQLELLSTQLASSASQSLLRLEADTRDAVAGLSDIALQQTARLDAVLARLDGLLANPSAVSSYRPASPTSGWTPGQGVPG